jgi:hypothetical protein
MRTREISILKSISNGLKSGSIKPTDSLLEELEKIGVNTNGLKKSNKVYVKKDNNAA